MIKILTVRTFLPFDDSQGRTLLAGSVAILMRDKYEDLENNKQPKYLIT